MNINIFEIFKNEYFTFILYAKFEAINFFYFIVKIVLQILLLLFAILQIILHMEEIFEHLNIFSYILLILNPITEGLNFLPSHD